MFQREKLFARSIFKESITRTRSLSETVPFRRLEPRAESSETLVATRRDDDGPREINRYDIFTRAFPDSRLRRSLQSVDRNRLRRNTCSFSGCASSEMRNSTADESSNHGFSAGCSSLRYASFERTGDQRSGDGTPIRETDPSSSTRTRKSEPKSESTRSSSLSRTERTIVHLGVQPIVTRLPVTCLSRTFVSRTAIASLRLYRGENERERERERKCTRERE